MEPETVVPGEIVEESLDSSTFGLPVEDVVTEGAWSDAWKRSDW